MDVTQEPVKSDVIVSLGGGGGQERIEKAVELYTKGYALQNLLILTGDESSIKKNIYIKDRRIQYIEKNNLKNINILKKIYTINTKNEILFIKNFLIDNNYKSAIIVSDAPHSRRISKLIDILKVEGDDGLVFNLVATDTNWWIANTYYRNKRAKNFAFLEVIKLSYAYFAYGVLEKIGILNLIEDKYPLEKIKKNILKEYNQK